MIILITNLEDLRTISTRKTIKFLHAGGRYGISWDPDRGEWWLVHENSEYNNWYKDKDLPQLVLDAIPERP